MSHYLLLPSFLARTKVFTAVTMKKSVFRDVTPCGSCKNRRFGGKYRIHNQRDNNRRVKNNVNSKSNRSALPHGVTSQKTAFFFYFVCITYCRLVQCSSIRSTRKPGGRENMLVVRENILPGMQNGIYYYFFINVILNLFRCRLWTGGPSVGIVHSWATEFVSSCRLWTVCNLNYKLVEERKILMSHVLGKYAVRLRT
jgi:hypothetical protein